MQSPSADDAAKQTDSKSDETAAFGKAKRRPVAAAKGGGKESKSPPRPQTGRAPDRLPQAAKPSPKRLPLKTPAMMAEISPSTEGGIALPPPVEANKSPYRWDTRFTVALIILVVGINLTLTLLFGRHDDNVPDNQAVADLLPAAAVPAPAMRLPADEDAPLPVQIPSSAPTDNAAEAIAAPVGPPPAAAPARIADEAGEPEAIGAAQSAAMLDRLNAAEPAAAPPPPASKPVKPTLDTKKLLEIINQY